MTDGKAGAQRAQEDHDHFSLVDAATDIRHLLEVVNRAVHDLFRRKADRAQREKSLLAVTAYFYAVRDAAGAEAEKLAGLRTFAKETLRIIHRQRPAIAAKGGEPLPGGRRATDAPEPQAVPASAPPVMEMAALLDSSLTVEAVEKPTDILVPPAMEARTHANFRALFTSALQYRLSGVTRFFQRQHGELPRELVKPFLLSAEFEAKLFAVVSTAIVPRMFATSRSMLMLESSQNWAEVNDAQFWAIIDGNEKTRAALTAVWEEAWSVYRQREAVKKDADGQVRRVLQASPELKELREKLAPDSPSAYDLPAIRNRELDLFVSLLNEFDVFRLDYCFNKLRQLYEQEMDRRWYQDKARQGALRDSLLEAIEAFPDRTGDFLALLCYYCLPNTDLFFLERFTHNKGANQAEREARLPYLMRFLAGERVPDIRLREMQDKRAKEEAAKVEAARQRDLERERQAQL